MINDVEPPEIIAKKLERAELIDFDGNKWIIRAGIEKEWVKEYADQLLDSAGQELWADIEKNIDLLQLAKELKKIKEKCNISVEISEAIDSAIMEAEKGNGAKTLKYLGKAGKWALDAATTIGTEVAAAAIKHTYGLT